MRPERLTTGSPIAESSAADQRTEGLHQRMVSWLRQRWCNHSSYIENIERRDDGQVQCPCIKCGKLMVAEYGLALPTNWQTKPANDQAQPQRDYDKRS